MSITAFHGLFDDGSDCAALRFALTLSVPRITTRPVAGFYLAAIAGRLTLCHTSDHSASGIYVDFASDKIRRRVAAGKRAALPRALGLHRNKSARVLDTTCGLGRDTAVLAAMGCTATALERHPALHALLADGRRRLEQEYPSWWRGRCPHFHHIDAVEHLTVNTPAQPVFDTIYIDPMFDSPRRKARPQQALHRLHELLGADTDAAELLALARQQAGRVVVKSHGRAQPLAPPDHQIGGKAVRFDVYFNASKSLK